jgi:cation:H+ antiporter
MQFMLSLWFHFGVSALFVVAAGLFIGRVSGELAERFHLGKAWAGAVLLSFATTLPELVATLTVVLRGDTGLAIGGILGSVLFNLFILVLVDLADPDPIYHRISKNHLLTGLLGCVLLASTIAGLALSTLNIPQFENLERIGFVSISSIAILFFYTIGQLILFQVAKSDNNIQPVKMATVFDRFSTLQVLGMYGFLAGVIIIAAWQLGISAEQIGDAYNLSATFAGAILIGIVTSLPELTNGIACSLQREHDLAMGNILGANAIVIVVLAIADFVSFKETLFSSLPLIDVTSSIVMASIGIVMQGVALGALAGSSTHRIWRFGAASILLMILYIISLVVSYKFSSIKL